MTESLDEPIALIDLGAFICPGCLGENADFLRIKPNGIVVRGATVCCPHIDSREIGQTVSIDEAIRLLKVAADDSESKEYRQSVGRVIGFLRGRYAFPITKDVIRK